MRASFLCYALILVATLSSPTTMAGSILREVWTDIPGTAIADLTNSVNFPSTPTSTNLVTDFFEAPTDILENYGQRMHGYVIPPVTGAYTFWIATDDGGELWLSSDNDPANRKLIANVTGWTSSREWTREANQQSAPVTLTAGRAYYVSALMKEGGGGDNLAVRWLRPDGVDEGPIPATYLLPYGTSFTPPIITAQPTNTTAIEGQLAIFTIRVSNLDVIGYRWQHNGTNLPGTLGSTLQYGPVTLADNGSQFQAFLTNRLGSTNTTIATLTVVPDTALPTLAAALNVGQRRITLQFNEPVETVTATNRSNYAVTPDITLAGVVAGTDSRSVELIVSPLSYGSNYTVTVSHVRDRAATPNEILPDSSISFTAVEYVPQDIGAPALGGTSTYVPGGVDVHGAGKTIGGTQDQFQFAWQRKSGDFDIQTRVTGLTLPDPYARAGLMVRETLAPNARFGASFAGSPLVGCFFESRAAIAAAASVASLRTAYPVNYPYTWLRLRRQGDLISGYASTDTNAWVSLGSVSLKGLAADVYVGPAVSSDIETSIADASFRDIATTTSTAIATYSTTREPLGPSSRATSLVFSEIMYHPAARTDELHLGFIELANARSTPEDLSGWRISGAVDYTFPAGFVLRAGECVVIASAPDDLRTIYGITNVLGPYVGDLPNDSGTLRLRNHSDAIRLDVTYGSKAPWPVSADGAGHSLVLTRPSYGEADPRAWSASELPGGSPGTLDPVIPTALKSVVINEFLAHTDLPQVDYIELYNHSNQSVDISGCWISDHRTTNRFQIPASTILQGRGLIAFTSDQLGFRLDAAGETLFFRSGRDNRVLDAVRFDGQENGVSSGRSPDGDPTIRRLLTPTLGTTNSRWRQEAVVINEIMYDPISGDDADQFIELYNRTTSPLDLTGWKLSDAVGFTFPSNSVLPASGFIVIAKDPAHLRANYPNLGAQNTLGGFSGKLSNNGEHIVLSQPHPLVSTNDLGNRITNLIQIPITEVRYGIGGRWGQWAKGGGSSLEFTDPNADPLRAANWADSDETSKAPWTIVNATNILDNGNTSFAVDRLRICMQKGGECLIDDLEVFKSGTVTNLLDRGSLDTDPTGWSFFGDHSLSSIEPGTGINGTRSLHVRGLNGGDTGINSIRANLKTGLASGNTGVIRAKVRWLKGWPEVLIRLQGNYMEVPVRMTLPSNLGSPGMANSRLISNAGPAIFDVTHSPALPRAGEQVKVLCRITDPDGLGTARVLYRLDPDTTTSTVPLRDDGQLGDDIAGDGLYTATLPAQGGGTLLAFRISAADTARTPVTSLFPPSAPTQECLIRWDEPGPSGTFPDYHVWSTAATQQAMNSVVGLDNTWRTATLVCGNHRVIYNAGYRNKGSPWHAGYGDIVVTVPEDDLLLGTTDRNFASTGNGGPEETDIRSQFSAWVAQQLNIPYLHAHYVRFYLNGGLFRTVSEDLEVPDRDYATRWFPEGGRGDLFKLAIWFEFIDDNQSFNNPIHCTMERFLSAGSLKMARYRWNWERRPDGGTANNYTNVFDLVTAANDTSTLYTAKMLNLADMEEWMRVFAFHRISGNWDSWTYNVGQNMYALKQPGYPWVLIPWDIDFTFGLGDGPTAAVGGGSFGGGSQDPVGNAIYNNPTFRRMLWRAYQDAINGPLQATNYAPQIATRRSALLKNGITDAADPRGIATYIEQRRAYLQQQLTANDSAQFTITSNGGGNYTSTTSTTSIQGNAPFAVATIEVNGIPYPATWTSQTGYRISVPLTQATNRLVLVGKDLRGNAVPGATRTVTVTYTGAVPQAREFVSINEIQYNPVDANASYVELYNRSTSVPFDLTACRFEGLGYVFPTGSIIAPSSYLLLVKNRAGFSKAYGATIPIFDEFPGSLDNQGEYLALIQPGVAPAPDQVITDVRYSSKPPWPGSAAGLGPSLQLIDSSQDAYRVGNWASAATNELTRFTPGRVNTKALSLATFPPLWINEIQTANTADGADNAGQLDPWIELSNRGTNTLDLSAFYLTDTYTNLTRWPFPAGSTLAPGGFVRVWVDGDAAQTTSNQWHASFRLSTTNGSIALVRNQGSPSAPAVIDFVDYPAMSPGRSYGSFPDGEPRSRQLFSHATPQGTNDPAWPVVAITINEFMAGNTNTIVNPATGKFDDWFELHNAGSVAVDLSGYFLTDNLTNANNWTIPVGTTLPAGGFLLCWADKQSSANRPGAALHTGFKLSKSGGELGLFAPSRTYIDGFVYGLQVPDVSLGRYPDGTPLPLFDMVSPTPGQPNILAGGNRPPVFDAAPQPTVAEGSQVQFSVHATDPDAAQQITYSLATSSPPGATIDPILGTVSWTPGESDGPATIWLAIFATDSGIPARSTTLRVPILITEVNQPPTLISTPGGTIQQGQTFTAPWSASDPDVPANRLVYSLGAGAPAGASVDPTTGVFTWTPGFSIPQGDHTITAVVTDNGAPPLSGSRSFVISVTPAPQPPIFDAVGVQHTVELVPWQLPIHASDPEAPQTPVNYSLDVAPANALINRTTGVISWLPAEGQAPTNAVFVVRAASTVAPFLTATTTFSVIVDEVNLPPVLANITNQVLAYGQTLSLTNTAQDPDLPVNTLTFSLAPGAPAGMSIDSSTGVLNWTPAANQVPSTNQITVRVVDNGSPAMQDAQTFTVQVKRGSPWRYVTATGTASSSTLYIYLSTPGDVYVDDLKLVAGTVAEAGPNLLAGGDFETPLSTYWTVSPNHQPSETLLSVKHSGQRGAHIVATEGGSTRGSSIFQDITPAISSGINLTLSFWYLPGPSNTTLNFRLSGSGINCVVPITGVANAAPKLGSIPDLTVDAGATVGFLVPVTDADLPNQDVFFSLDAPVIPGATIDPGSGLFSWTATGVPAPSTNRFTVRVTDNGGPALSDSRSFLVMVRPSKLELTFVGRSPEGTPTFAWDAIPGRTYRIETKDSLSDTIWKPLAEIVATVTPTRASDAQPPTGSGRFYRVVLLP